jgi:hypothetical protein
MRDTIRLIGQLAEDEVELDNRLVSTRPSVFFIRRFFRGVGALSAILLVADALSWPIIDDNPKARIVFVLCSVSILAAVDTVWRRYRFVAGARN